MRTDDDSTKDGGGTEDGVRWLHSGYIRSFTINADPLFELHNDTGTGTGTGTSRLVENSPLNLIRMSFIYRKDPTYSYVTLQTSFSSNVCV